MEELLGFTNYLGDVTCFRETYVKKNNVFQHSLSFSSAAIALAAPPAATPTHDGQFQTEAPTALSGALEELLASKVTMKKPPGPSNRWWFLDTPNQL